MKVTLMMVVSVAAFGECLPARGDRITAADVASAVPSFAQLAPDLALSYSPNPGSRRVFPSAELQRHLDQLGVETAVADAVCFEWPMRTVTPEELRTVMLTALPPGAELEIHAPSNLLAPPGTLEFPIAGLRNGVWRGHVFYASRRRYPLSVSVNVRVPWTRVVTNEPIRAGERIGESSLRVVSGAGEPTAGNFVEGVAEAVGRVALRLLRPGVPLEKAAIGPAQAVARGDAVHVEVVSGGAVLRFEGIAEAPAREGALVPVRNSDTGKIVHARVGPDRRARLILSAREN